VLRLSLEAALPYKTQFPFLPAQSQVKKVVEDSSDKNTRKTENSDDHCCSHRASKISEDYS
jgi:hypothetical protein